MFSAQAFCPVRAALSILEVSAAATGAPTRSLVDTAQDILNDRGNFLDHACACFQNPAVRRSIEDQGVLFRQRHPVH